MRSAMLLLATVLLFVCPPISKPNRSVDNDLPVTRLSRYTYFLTTIAKNAGPNGEDSLAYGSGFFIRDTANRLFLVTASHLFTHCNLLAYAPWGGKMPDSLLIWYKNKKDRYTFKEFSIKAYWDQPCDSLHPRADIDIMNVNDSLGDEGIFSIDQLAPHFWIDSNRLAPHDRMICYGFSDPCRNNRIPQIDSSPILPCPASAKVDYWPYGLGDFYKSYIAITPKMEQGFSGAPVFRIKGRQIEYAGLQSFSTQLTPNSLIVKGERLGDLLHWK